MLGVTQLVIPTIRCSLNQLAWPKVCSLIKNVLQHSRIQITVFLWQQMVKSHEDGCIPNVLSDPVEWKIKVTKTEWNFKNTTCPVFSAQLYKGKNKDDQNEAKVNKIQKSFIPSTKQLPRELVQSRKGLHNAQWNEGIFPVTSCFKCHSTIGKLRSKLSEIMMHLVIVFGTLSH